MVQVSSQLSPTSYDFMEDPNMKKHHFLTKRLPAMCLALLLMGSMIPSAMADEPELQENPQEPEHHHQWSSDWTRDESSHWHSCADPSCSEKNGLESHQFTTSETPATCYQDGSKTETCSICGYSRTTTNSATGAHQFSDAWASDESAHWHACTTPGCPATSDKTPHQPNGNGIVTEANCTQAGSITYTCQVCGKTYTQKTGNALGHVDTNQDNKCDRCGVAVVTNVTVIFQNGTSTYSSQTIPSGTAPQNPGAPIRSASGVTYTFRGWTTSNPGSASAYTGQSCLSSAEIAARPLTANTTYYAVYTVNAVNRTGSFSVTGSTAGVSVGSALSNQISNAFYSVTGGNFSYVRFTGLPNSNYGVLYTSSDRRTPVSSSNSFSYSYSNVSSFYFVPGGNGNYTLSYSAYDAYGNTVSGTVTLSMTFNTVITYKVAPGQSINFDRTDFNRIFQTAYPNYALRYVTFGAPSAYDSSDGAVYYRYGFPDERSFARNTLDNYNFYYSNSSYGSYALGDLSFVAGSSFKTTLRLSFRAYYSNNLYVDGTLVIEPNGSAASTITYKVAPGDKVNFDRADFNRAFQDKYGNTSIRYVTLEAPTTYDSCGGSVCYNYGYADMRIFTRSTLDNYKYYYSSSNDGDYALGNLSFAAGSDFLSPIQLTYRAYASDNRYVTGTLRIEPNGTAATQGNIVYTATYNTPMNLNANDFARFFASTYPNYQFQYVKLEGVPSTGSLYYNYYATSKYGPNQLRLTSTNCGDQPLYFSPASASQYALSEITYIPSGVNYCTSIPFTAYGSNARSVRGTVLISVNIESISEVYGVTPKGSTVSFPASAIYTAVTSATSTPMASFQLLSLPTASQGVIYAGGSNVKANTSTRYVYSGSGQAISQLRFVPAGSFTGSVEIPYVAYSSNGTAIGVGKFCLGVVNSIRQFKDMSSSTWCYKYVTELSDAKVIDGFTDGTFRPNNTVTCGQALKLIMLAAGYPAQPKTSTHPFSGYLSRAQKDGLVSGSINLDTPITRLAVAQIAAKAMKLDIYNLSSVKPFTDTADPYVQALNAAGIVEGYFSNGTSTYKPSNTLTRGQISAIVWRMDRAL